MQNFQARLPSIQEDLSGVKDELNVTTENIRLHKMERKSCENGVNRFDVSLEEKCTQMTPPDPDMFTQTEDGESAENMEINTLLTKNHSRKNLSVGSAMSNNIGIGLSSDGKHGTDSINSQVLNPCTRLRVFNNPRSVSYRRLLPFLMEISNHNSIINSRIYQQQKPMVELKEKLHPLSAATSVEHKHVKKIRTEISSEKQHTRELEQNVLPAIVPPLGGLSRDTSTNPSSSMPSPSSTINSSNVEPSSVASENATSPCVILDSVAEGILQSQSSPRKLGPQGPHNNINAFESKENCSVVPPSSTVNHDILTGQSTSLVAEPEPVPKQSKCLDVGLEVHNDNRESIEQVHLDQGAFKIKVCDTLVSAIHGPSKGILKKNPRGCRGPCNCLNCASFRLHTERAYEFSRNQMRDAEEVASELMKELAKLRHVLEKSIVNENNPTVIPLNPIQVKQACAEALETEKLAKERLSQLYCDLDIHCRIPVNSTNSSAIPLLQRKVTFSNCIQERASQC